MKSTISVIQTKLLLVLALGAIPFVLSAQKNSATPATNNTASSSNEDFTEKWSIGVHGGSVIYFGSVKQNDFAPLTSNKNEIGYGLGLRFSRSLNYLFSLQGDIMNGTLNGTYRPSSKHPNRLESFYFTGDFWEYSLSATVNLGNLVARKSISQRKFTCYASAGLGLGGYRAKLKDYTTGALLATNGYDINTGKSKRDYEVMVPVALGIKYRISPSIDLGLENSIHLVNSNKLDTRPAMPDNTYTPSNDKYMYTKLTITYKLGGKSDKDAWVNPLDGIPAKQDSIKQKVDAMSTDSDKDGVADLFDKDNTTPDGAKTYGDGTAVDSDMDGVPDYKDAEPFSSKGAKVDANGREIDTDGDGVPDSKDLEPNTLPGAMVNFQGRTIKVEEAKHDPDMAVYFPSIYFGVGSSQVQYKYYENLAAVARVLKANPSVKITVTGNTDVTGNDVSNDKLGQKRAKAVVDHLVKVYGLDANRFSTESKGKKDPLATKENSINRRVDFNLKK